MRVFVLPLTLFRGNISPYSSQAGVNLHKEEVYDYH